MIRSGARKNRGNEVEPLDDTAFAKLQRSCDRAALEFANMVAMGRGLSLDDVLKTEADWFDAEDGLALGLLDAVQDESVAWVALQDSLARSV